MLMDEQHCWIVLRLKKKKCVVCEARLRESKSFLGFCGSFVPAGQNLKRRASSNGSNALIAIAHSKKAKEEEEEEEESSDSSCDCSSR